jgi:hypothetical protein
MEAHQSVLSVLQHFLNLVFCPDEAGYPPCLGQKRGQSMGLWMKVPGGTATQALCFLDASIDQQRQISRGVWPMN